MYHQSSVTEYLKTKDICPACTKKWEVEKTDDIINQCMIKKCEINLSQKCYSVVSNKWFQIFTIWASQIA